jgi:hypothetical protein
MVDAAGSATVFVRCRTGGLVLTRSLAARLRYIVEAGDGRENGAGNLRSRGSTGCLARTDRRTETAKHRARERSSSASSVANRRDGSNARILARKARFRAFDPRPSSDRSRAGVPRSIDGSNADVHACDLVR